VCLNYRLTIELNKDYTGTTENPSTDVVATTSFVDDAKVVTQHTETTEPDYALYKFVQSIDQKSIIDYLMKPQVLQQGNFNTTDTPTTFSLIGVYNSLRTNLNNHKLYGFLGIRADVRITVQLNAQRFTQGRYLVYYIPTGGSTTGTTMITALHEANICTRTQLPGIQLDLNCDTAGSFMIPFCAAQNYYPIHTTLNTIEIAYVRVSPYVPISNGACSFTLWANYENIQLFGAALPQSGRIKEKSITKSSSNIIEKEKKGAQKGVISDIAFKVKDAANFVGRIPGLSSFTGPVSMVADVVGNVASIFGWSKPDYDDGFCNMFMQGHRNVTNYDGIDIGLPMSLSAKNSLQITQFASTNVDEMAWDYIKTIPAVLTSFTFTTANNIGDSLATVNLAYNASVSNVLGGGTTTTFLPCTMPSMWFKMARGSFNVTIKCVKTEFHSGRISMSVIPNAGGGLGAGTLNVTNTDYLRREILDLRLGTEWTFNVPYEGMNAWRTNPMDFIYSVLQFYVVDQLEAPATVSSSVTLLIELSGGEDLEYAYPITNNYTPTGIYTPQSGDVDCVKKVAGVGGSTPMSMSPIPAAVCIGEQFVSLRQLLKKSTALTALGASAINRYFYFNPYSYELPVVTGATIGVPGYSADVYTQLSAMYALTTGSLRCKWLRTQPAVSYGAGDTSIPVVSLYRSTSIGTVGQFSATSIDGTDTPAYLIGAPALATMPQQDAIAIDVHIPPYMRNHAIATKDCYVSTQLVYARTYPNTFTTAPDVGVNVTNMFATAPGINVSSIILRSGGEDMSFGAFISTVPMTTPTVGTWGS